MYNTYKYEELESSQVLDFTLTVTNGYAIQLTPDGYELTLNYAKQEGITFQEALVELVEMGDHHEPTDLSDIFTRLERVHNESELWEN